MDAAADVKLWTVDEANALIPRLVPLVRELGRAHDAGDEDRLARALAAFAALGVEPKDPHEGLVDFPTMRGSEVVYLCWRMGETEITHWHSMTGGFRGRKPLDALVRAGGR